MRGAMLLLLAALSLASAAAPPCSYLIKAGDTIYALAQTYGLTVDVITAVNQLSNADVLQPGIVIDLPCSGNATSATSVLDLLANRADLSTLFRAAVAAGFADTLADEALVATVFAPNNTAFERLLERVLSNTTLDELLADGQELEELLAYHVVPGEALPAADLTQGLNLTTALDGEFLQVFKPANITRLSTSTGQYVRVLEADLKAGKSVLHITKGVMVPASSGIVLPQPSASCSHTVVEGDTLFGLATEVGSSVAALVDLNPALEADPTKLALGDEVILSADCEV